MPTRNVRRRCRGDEGSVMPMATIFVIFLMIGAWALVSASQQWGARREAHAVAASAARAGAQGDQNMLRTGGVLDPDTAAQRAQAILTASGYSGSVSVDGATVTVTVTATVEYAFPAPGFPGAVSGSSTAIAQRGVNGQEGG
jgi:Putative Flp pilus-assembly TadE/G-like